MSAPNAKTEAVTVTVREPIPGLMVEIWHADAGGNYSGFGSGGSTITLRNGADIVVTDLAELLPR